MDGKGKGESNRAFSVRRESQLCYSGTGMCSLSYPAVQGLVSRNLCLGKAYIYLRERGQMSTAFPVSCRLVTASKGLLVVFWKVEQEKYVPLASDQYLKTPSVSTPLSPPTSLNEVSKGWYSCFCLLQPWEACPPST